MARALIVACGCRGLALGRHLVGQGWRVRGTTRDPARAGGIEAAGVEAAVADPDSVGTILDHVGDVAVLFWLLGSARGEPDRVAALHGPRLERLLEELVDSPVRGVVYEAGGTVEDRHLRGGAELVSERAVRHRIPLEIVTSDPAEPSRWTRDMAAAAHQVLAR